MCRKKLFSTLLRQYGELIDSLMKQTIQLHSQVMATSILLDAESTDWANNKDFYEASYSLSLSLFLSDSLSSLSLCFFLSDSLSLNPPLL